jgi:hypothetical protein
MASAIGGGALAQLGVLQPVGKPVPGVGGVCAVSGHANDRLDTGQIASLERRPCPVSSGAILTFPVRGPRLRVRDHSAAPMIRSTLGWHADFRAIEHATGSKILVARNLGLATQVVAAPQLLHGGLPLVGA